MQFLTRLGLCISLICSFTLIACSGSSKKEQKIPPEVSVIQVTPTHLTLEDHLTGRLEALRKAEMRARTSGIVKKRYFEEGSYVKQGALLFLIDDKSEKAQVAQAQANYQKAASVFHKIAPLISSGAISQADYDNALTTMQAAKAALNAAQVNLDYAHIRAPISGKIGKSYVTEGMLVGQGTPTLLAVIQQEDPLKIDIHQSVEDFTKLKKYATLSGQNIKGLPFKVRLQDGQSYPHAGHILFIDASIDENTGQVLLKGEIPNPEHQLLPGLFVNLDIAIGTVPNLYKIPSQAVTMNETGGTVIVVHKDGTYIKRQINIVKQDPLYVYSSEGLKEGDLILVEGTMKLLVQPPKVNYSVVKSESIIAPPKPGDEKNAGL